MWHEARKQEKKIRGIMNDFYKRRSERRKQFYDIVVSFILFLLNQTIFHEYSSIRKQIQCDFFNFMDQNVAFIMMDLKMKNNKCEKCGIARNFYFSTIFIECKFL